MVKISCFFVFFVRACLLLFSGLVHLSGQFSGHGVRVLIVVGVADAHVLSVTDDYPGADIQA